jgi:hypothetical protein
MRTLALVLLLSPSIALACGQAIPPPILDPPRVTAPPITVPPVGPLRAEVVDEDDVREAVFRHLFDHNASGMQKNAKVFCLQIEGKQDPSSELLRRFDGNEPRVKQASLCAFKPGHARGGVVDETGAPGLIFRVDTIQHTGENAATVEGGYFEAGLSASGNVYELVREGNQWIVKKDTMKWIS